MEYSSFLKEAWYCEGSVRKFAAIWQIEKVVEEIGRIAVKKLVGWVLIAKASLAGICLPALRLWQSPGSLGSARMGLWQVLFVPLAQQVGRSLVLFRAEVEE
jgi:hypothetical protein